MRALIWPMTQLSVPLEHIEYFLFVPTLRRKKALQILWIRKKHGQEGMWIATFSEKNINFWFRLFLIQKSLKFVTQ